MLLLNSVFQFYAKFLFSFVRKRDLELSQKTLLGKTIRHSEVSTLRKLAVLYPQVDSLTDQHSEIKKDYDSFTGDSDKTHVKRHRKKESLETCHMLLPQ